MIREQQLDSLSRLADFTGRALSNLSRTPRTMERYGLVELLRQHRQVRPVVKAATS
ncbi:MAG TPA: hypothetical protein VFG73_03430 [Rhodanobacteraceae bacterium]|nr:hypothetical protein [Rhodanobacteraceae bacterium]